MDEGLPLNGYDAGWPVPCLPFFSAEGSTLTRVDNFAIVDEDTVLLTVSRFDLLGRMIGREQVRRRGS